MSDKEIQVGDHIEYAPYHAIKNPEAANKSTGEVVEINDRPTRDDPEHRMYTILNDNTQKKGTYAERAITAILEREASGHEEMK